jgi:hypothetical protein
VDQARLAVAAQARRLTRVEAQHQRATAAVLVERDEVVQLRLSIVDRELQYSRARARDMAALNSLRATLAREAATLEQQAAAAQTSAFANGSPPPGGCINTPFVPHGGEYGFFPAPGTNYTVNQEPVIAARLDALGKALQLRLIASPATEATLEQFCLTRPFPGPREADHIQEL